VTPPTWLYWPATASAPWVPSDLTGLQCWLDASDSTTLFDAATGGSLPGNNGAVGRWEDKSGNAYHADDAVDNTNAKITTARPTRVTAEQNGRDALAFNAQRMDHNTSRAMLKDRSCALFAAVGKYGGDLTNFRFMWSHCNTSTTGFRAAFSTASGGSGVFRLVSRRQNADGSGASITSAADTNWHVFVGFLDWTNGNAEFFIDGASVGTGSYAASGQTDNTDLSTASSACTAVGHFTRDGSVGSPLSSGSRIGELVCAARSSSSYTTGDREKLEGYLAHKWGLEGNLPGGHPYKSAAP
jgi:hypothetical protein